MLRTDGLPLILDNLPIEVLARILSYCEVVDLLRMRLMAKLYMYLINSSGDFPVGMQLYLAVIDENESEIKKLSDKIYNNNKEEMARDFIEAINIDSALVFTTFTDLLKVDELVFKSRMGILLECNRRLKWTSDKTSDEMKAVLVKFAMRLIRSMNHVFLNHFESIFCLNLGYYDDKMSENVRTLLLSTNYDVVEDGIFTQHQIISRLYCLDNIFGAVNELLTEIPPEEYNQHPMWSKSDKLSIIKEYLLQAQAHDSEWYVKWINYFDHQSLTKEQKAQFKMLYSSLIIPKPEKPCVFL